MDRWIIHREGLWHRGAIIFLFSEDGRLLIQRRQVTKDVYPGAWDVSVAEHLIPGEAYEAGAARGLKEELGIDGVRLTPMGRIFTCCTDIPALGIRDYEFQQAFCTTYSGPLRPDTCEVSQTKFVTLKRLGLLFQEKPEAYTPWFRRCAVALGLLTGDA